MRRHGKYDGDASVNRADDKRVRVWIEAPNFTGEVYIPNRKAKELRDTLNSIFAPKRLNSEEPK